MAFRGLFIGIDRYISADVNELSCARRDAVALEALFADTLGGETVLLCDADATCARIQTEFEALLSCAQGDTVVITFSGHGSETHELVTHETTFTDFENTTIPLARVADWFSRIPAKRLIFILDCCFSGGIGAKVLHVEAVPRDVRSLEAQLGALAGEGRIIFTASSPTEPAYEDTRHGHGLLTLFVIEAIRGAAEIVEGGRIGLYRLLDHVTRRVIDAARQLGRPQNPTIRGKIDGEMTWPVFVAGQRYRAAFPERTGESVTGDLSSLRGVGFPEQLVQAWAASIPALNDLQVEAINSFGILNDEHLLVSAPTSSGKTMIGELAALRHVLERRRALFLLPLKALVSDKRRQFQRDYGPFGIRTIEATGETDDITPLLRGRYDVALLTYEKFAAVALSHPHIIEQAGVIVVDEVQMIADASRGANLEFILTLIAQLRTEHIEPQTVCLSAVIGDTNWLERWLGGRLLRRTERPVPLDEGVLLEDGRFRFIDAENGQERIGAPIITRLYTKGSSQDWIIPLAIRLVGEGQQIIVFREKKGDTRGCARYLARALGLTAADEAIARLPTGDPSQASSALREVLSAGVAFHNADLEPIERTIVEEEYRRADSRIRVIVATTTLAMGVNTPANSVIIGGLMHPGPGGKGQPYSVAEYKNLVGRAGRLGFAARGTSYLLATSGRDEHAYWHRYVTGQPEDLRSRILDQETDVRSLIVRVIVAARRLAGRGVSADRIVGFLEASFGAYQAKRANAAWALDRPSIVQALNDLEHHKLVQANAEGDYELTALGRLAGQTGAEVGSIIRLVDCLQHIRPDEITDPTLLTAVQTTRELDQMLFPLNKSSKHKEPQAWSSEIRRQGVPDSIVRELSRGVQNEAQATLRAKKAVACLLFVSGKPMSEIEAALMQFDRSDDAAGPVRAVSARTCDFVTVAARVAEILHPGLDLADRTERLTFRLTHGIAAGAVNLARELNTQLLRGDYARLLAAGLTEPAAIAAADEGKLSVCLGGDKAKAQAVRAAGRAVAESERRQKTAIAPILEAYEP